MTSFLDWNINRGVSSGFFISDPNHLLSASWADRKFRGSKGLARIEYVSTTIDVYPTTDYLPLVEETRSRTQELYQQLLDRYGIDSTVEVKAFYFCNPDEESRRVDSSTRWHVEMDLYFAYAINGEWRSGSFPTLMERALIDQYDIDDFVKSNGEKGYPPSQLGECEPLDVNEFDVPISKEEMRLLNAQRHFWYDLRYSCSPAVPSVGYGFVAAALAEETEGLVSSMDGAFEGGGDGHNGETAEQFLTWWGDSQMAFYGRKPFL
ncbi:hypothetical protein [Bifidobacterium simiarum]|uniref:hypothetical protein n=1 Tax=Bifidobacterium simiarum TaxID=2045441 RepID=UPI001BDBDDE3|nr:hypothetical protein [Bifidobacterium simiarum]MBT1166714.1 hypothetical protein [Bifidobacterium simiarum]